MGQLWKKENQQFTELLFLYYNVRDLPCHDFFDCITAKTAVSTEAGYERIEMRRKGQRKIVKFAALLLATALLGAAPAQASGVQVNPTIRVGIFFGGSALPGANLLNHVGSGYRFGYFDSGLNFIQLGFTGETAISMVKTQNVWYHEGQYTDAAGSGPAVGCYHLLLPGSYPDFQSAQAAAALYPGGFPAWIDGVYQVRVGAYLDGGSAQAAQTALGLGSAQVVGTSGSGVSVVQTSTGKILFQFDSTGGLFFAVKPGLDELTKTQTIFRNNTYYGSFQYQRSGGNMTVVNVLPMEDYIQGVVLSEMMASWPVEALKAQAVCARTYGYRKLLEGKHRASGFDICNGVDCQAYRGIAGMTDGSRQAVEETYGEYIWYGASLAEPVYFNSDGGATESAVNVWSENVPYLQGKIDPYEAAAASQIERYNWTVTFTRQELTDLLNAKGHANSGIVDVRVSQTSPTGNVTAITFIDSSGKTITRTKESCRTLLGLRSQRYTISGGSGTGEGGAFYVDAGETLPTLSSAYAIDGSGGIGQAAPGGQAYAITGGGEVSLVAGAAGNAANTSASNVFTFTGSGWGHSVGMSQWGAYAMAEAGYAYRDILQFYYTGIEVRQP